MAAGVGGLLGDPPAGPDAVGDAEAALVPDPPAVLPDPPAGVPESAAQPDASIRTAAMTGATDTTDAPRVQAGRKISPGP